MEESGEADGVRREDLHQKLKINAVEEGVSPSFRPVVRVSK